MDIYTAFKDFLEQDGIEGAISTDQRDIANKGGKITNQGVTTDTFNHYKNLYKWDNNIQSMTSSQKMTIIKGFHTYEKDISPLHNLIKLELKWGGYKAFNEIYPKNGDLLSPVDVMETVTNNRLAYINRVMVVYKNGHINRTNRFRSYALELYRTNKLNDGSIIETVKDIYTDNSGKIWLGVGALIIAGITYKVIKNV